MSYNKTSLDLIGKYTDELSFELISKAVLQTNVMNYASIRSGLKFGDTNINLLDSTNIGVKDRGCGWSPSGTLDYTAVTVTMVEKEIKQALCPTDLRDYYLAEQLSASAHAEEVAFEEVTANFIVEKIKNWNETYVGGEIYTKVNALATSTSQAAASDATTIVADVMDVIDAVDAAVLDRDDLAVVMSPAYFNMLRRALTAQDLYHFNAPGVNSNTELMMPGTDFKVIKSSGFTTPGFIAGPMKDIVIGCGLEDDFDQLSIFYSADNDEVRVMAAWRLGVGIVDGAKWATNGL